jgi:hypothetical protein
MGRERRPTDVRPLDARNLTGGFFCPTGTGTDENGQGRRSSLAVNKHHVISLEGVP